MKRSMIHDPFDASLVNSIVNNANETRRPLLAFVDTTTDRERPKGVVVYHKDHPNTEYILENVRLDRGNLVRSNAKYHPTRRSVMKAFHETPHVPNTEEFIIADAREAVAS